MIAHLAAAMLIAIAGATTAGAVQRSKRTVATAGAASLLRLENKRPVSLLNFEVVLPDAEKPERGRIVARLVEPLAAGRSIELRLGAAKGRRFDVHWRFEDSADAGSVDLCKDAHIVLTD
jgi:hypothetical protein